MTLPNFLIIGAAKSGTTSLYRYLGQHPQVYANVKEPSYFALAGKSVQYNGPGDQEGFVRRVTTDRDAYERLFDGVTQEKAYGEASVLYLYSPEAPGRIKQTIPDVKLMAILRNPVERAFSGFLHMRRDGREPLADFAAALAAETSRVEANWEHQWHYTRLGYYYTQLKRYYDLFPAENIAVFTFDEFRSSPVAVLQDIFRFLEVDDSFVPDTSLKYNVSGIPQSRVLHKFLIRPNRLKDIARPLLPRSARRSLGALVRRYNITDRKPELPQDIRHYLVKLYRDEILQLESLINKDLSHWVSV